MQFDEDYLIKLSPPIYPWANVLQLPLIDADQSPEVATPVSGPTAPILSGVTSTAANLNDSVPPALVGFQNIKWQASAPYPDPNNPAYRVRDISAYVPLQLIIVPMSIDGAGSPIAPGVKGYFQLPYPGIIIGWSIIADQSGSISVDIDKHASPVPPSPPTVPNTTSDKISASAPVVLSSSQSAAVAATGVASWSTSIAQWDVLGFNVTSAATLTRVTIELYVART